MIGFSMVLILLQSLFFTRASLGRVHWQRPDEGWVCRNTDGAVFSSTGIRFVGGVFHANDGNWILGFNKSIGVTQPLQSELWAIFTGLHIARDNGFDRLLIQSDNLEAIKRLNASTVESDVNDIVRAIDRLKNAGCATMFQWIPYKENKLADAIAKLDTSYDLSLLVDPHTLLLPLLISDSSSSM
ncbi:hypothetical protein GQ457_10G005860 [Hibiscus cannabinus]